MKVKKGRYLKRKIGKKGKREDQELDGRGW